MAEEKVFYDGGNVKVTNSRFLTYGTTTSMSGVTSVSKYAHHPSRKGPIILAIIGLILFAWQWFIALIVIAAAVAWWMSQKVTYSIQLASASGQTEALNSKDESLVDQIIEALNEAIVYRN